MQVDPFSEERLVNHYAINYFSVSWGMENKPRYYVNNDLINLISYQRHVFKGSKTLRDCACLLMLFN